MNIYVYMNMIMNIYVYMKLQKHRTIHSYILNHVLMYTIDFICFMILAHVY